MPTSPSCKKNSARITFRLPDGRRKELFIPTSHAKLVEQKVKQLIFNIKYGFNTDADYEWFNSMPDASNLKRAIIRWGIFNDRITESHILSELMAIWIPTFVKENTRRIYSSAFNRLMEYLPDGASTPLLSIRPEDIIGFRQSLESRYKPTSIAGDIRAIKTGFGYAVKLKWLHESPARDITIKVSDTLDSSNWQYITTEQATMVITAPTTPARCKKIIALERFAGFRGPSELNALRWSDITPPAGDKRGAIVITSPKTERAGKASRTIPIAPELQAVLDKTPPEERKGRVIGSQVASQTSHNVRKAFEAVGITLTDTYLRRSYCSDIMARYGSDPALYEALTGHQFSVGMQHYQIMHPDRLDKVFKDTDNDRI